MSAGSDSVAGVHTPGPWSANNGGYVKADCNGIVVAEVRRPRSRGKDYWEDLPYCKANAALIAAAPELLEALEHIINGALSLPRFAEEQALAAIAKARSPQ